MLELFNFLALGAIPGMLWWMHRHNRFSLFPILYPTIILVWQGLSAAYLETGVYSPELFMTTEYTGGTLRFVCATLAFLGIYTLVFGLFVKDPQIFKNGRLNDRLSRETFNLWMVTLAFLSGVILLKNAPEGDILSRTRYLTENPVFIRDLIFKYLPAISFLLGLAGGATKKQTTRSVSFLTLFLFLYILLLYGNKFSGLLGVVSFFLIGYFTISYLIPMARPVFWISPRTQMLVGVVVMFAFVGTGISKYIASGGNRNVTEYLFERIFVLQGGIWWHTDYLVHLGIERTGFSDFISFMKSVDYHPNSSLMYLMTKAIGHEMTYKLFFLNQSLYTGAFPAIFYEFFGFPSLIMLSALCGACIAAVSGYMLKKLFKGQTMLLIVSFLIYVPIAAVMDSGEFLQLFSVNLIIKIVLVMLFELAYKVSTQIVSARNHMDSQYDGHGGFEVAK